MSLSEGTILGSYEIAGQLGAGGMGEVWRAVDTKLGRDVAIKTLPAALADDANRLARFEREAKLLASLNHAHIATVYGLDEHEGTRFIAMEIVEGESLEQKLINGALPVEEALQIALQISQALEAAHDKGIVHRDLKPANIMLTPDGVVKVLDFGLAKAFSGEQGKGRPAHSPTLSLAMTQQGLVLGTAGYMSPEQASGQATDQRSDIWSFGVVLYEMLTGSTLFGGESIPHILAEVLKTEPDWDRLPPNAHPRIRNLLESCLAKKPRNRFHSVADVRVELQKVLADPKLLDYASPEVATAGSGRLRIAAAIVASVVITALVAVFVAGRLQPMAENPVIRFMDELEGFQFRAAVLIAAVIGISPDGSQIAYSSGSEIFIRDLDQTTPRRLVTVEGVGFAPAFSPDGQWLAYADGLAGAIYRIPVAGGTPQAITQRLQYLSYGLVWDERDMLMFTQPDVGIMQVPADGGTPELIVPAADGESLASAQLLPGDGAVMFSATTASGAGRWDAGNIVVQSLVTDERTVIWRGGSDARYLDSGHLVYAQGGGLFAVPFDLDQLRTTGSPVSVIQQGVARTPANEPASDAAQYAVSANGTLVYLDVPAEDDTPERSLAWIDRTGNRTTLDVRPDDYSEARISPDGTQVALVIGSALDASGNRDIWILNLEPQNLRQLTFEFSADSVVWSVDSSLVYFRSGAGTIFSAPADGGTPEQVGTPIEQAPFATPSSITPDGQTLVLTTLRTFEDMNVSTLELDTPDPPAELMLLLDDVTMQGYPAIAPNGEWMAYGEGSEVGIRPFPDVRRQLYRVGEGAHPVFSADGSELFYFDGSSIVAATVQLEPALRVATPQALFAHERLAVPNRAWDVHPDGERFLIILATPDSALSASPGIHTVVNWVEELKRLVPTD